MAGFELAAHFKVMLRCSQLLKASQSQDMVLSPCLCAGGLALTFIGELWFLCDGSGNLVPSFIVRAALWSACMVGSEL